MSNLLRNCKIHMEHIISIIVSAAEAIWIVRQQCLSTYKITFLIPWADNMFLQIATMIKNFGRNIFRQAYQRVFESSPLDNLIHL